MKVRPHMVHPQPSVPAAAESSDRSGPLPRGTKIEEFEISHVLGSSGFGIVYLARDHALDHTVALKEYLPETLAVRGRDGKLELREPSHADAFERGRQAFISEARILARCDHSSLLRVHRVWETRGTAYRVMPYYAGQSLIAVRHGMRGQPEEQALRELLFALLGALQTLHDAGHVHGDVSPESILLLPDDRPVLMDSGAVRRAILGDRIQHLMAAVKSPSAAQEPGFSSEPQGTWTDLHAMAAVAQFCISGELAASAPVLHESTHDEPSDATLHGLQQRKAGAPYSRSFLETLHVMRSVQPDDTLRSAAWFCDSLRNRTARLSGRIDPVLKPVLPDSVVASPPSATELTHDHFVADVKQVVASAAQQANRHNLAPVSRSDRNVAVARAIPRPRSARAPVWRGAALTALALGVAGWMLAERPTTISSPDGSKGATGQDKVPAMPKAGTLEDPLLAIGNALAPKPRDGAAPEPAPAPANDAPLAPKAAAQAASTELVAMAAQPTPERLTPAPTQRTVADKPAPSMRPTVKPTGSPREECGARTRFALYRCMQVECAQPRWAGHAQCVRLLQRDEVD